MFVLWEMSLWRLGCGGWWCMVVVVVEGGGEGRAMTFLKAKLTSIINHKSYTTPPPQISKYRASPHSKLILYIYLSNTLSLYFYHRGNCRTITTKRSLEPVLFIWAYVNQTYRPWRRANARSANFLKPSDPNGKRHREKLTKSLSAVVFKTHIQLTSTQGFFFLKTSLLI